MDLGTGLVKGQLRNRIDFTRIEIGISERVPNLKKRGLTNLFEKRDLKAKLEERLEALDSDRELQCACGSQITPARLMVNSLAKKCTECLKREFRMENPHLAQAERLFNQMGL